MYTTFRGLLNSQAYVQSIPFGRLSQASVETSRLRHSGGLLLSWQVIPEWCLVSGALFSLCKLCEGPLWMQGAASNRWIAAPPHCCIYTAEARYSEPLCLSPTLPHTLNVHSGMPTPQAASPPKPSPLRRSVARNPKPQPSAADPLSQTSGSLPKDRGSDHIRWTFPRGP